MMKILRVVSAVAICVVLVFSLVACSNAAATETPSKTKTSANASSAGSDIVIQKDEVTDQATFIPYEAENVKMEIIAVKAPDDTIRTALNTCQVCFDSGRGYYEQVGDRLVCQNCGNQFKISQIEKQKNGCNPVPILADDKKEDGTTITISADFLEKNKELFANWKTN
jgi:uncharacterized membrane protein